MGGVTVSDAVAKTREAFTVDAPGAQMHGRVSPYSLATAADVVGPDSVDSAGAAWLVRVFESALEAIEESANDGDTVEDVRQYLDDFGRAHEEADTAVPIYTHERWEVFTDLAAHTEDVEELAGDEHDLTALAGIALYIIAERLAVALWDDVAERFDELGEEECPRGGTAEVSTHTLAECDDHECGEV